MPFARGNPGVSILNSMGGRGLELASRGFGRMYDQSVLNRQIAERDFERRKAEREKKKAEREARRHLFTNIGVGVGATALTGGLMGLAAPTLGAAGAIGAGGASAGIGAADATADASRVAVTDAADETARSALEPALESSTTGTGAGGSSIMRGWSGKQPGESSFSRGVSPTSNEPVLVHRPFEDSANQALSSPGRTTYSPSSGRVETRSSRSGNFLRGAGEGLASGLIYGLASEFPAAAPAAQMLFNRADPLYQAKLGNERGRSNYQDFRVRRGEALLPHEVESERSTGFQRRAAGLDELASASEHRAGENYRRAITDPTVDRINAAAGAERSRGGYYDARTNRSDALIPYETDRLEAQSHERETAADRNVAQEGYYDAGTTERQGRERRAGELQEPTRRGREADADYKEMRNSHYRAENAGAFKVISYGSPEQSRAKMKELIAEAETNIDANPDADSRHVTIEKTLARWSGKIPEEYLMDIEAGWRRKYHFSPRASRGQRTEDSSGVLLE